MVLIGIRNLLCHYFHIRLEHCRVLLLAFVRKRSVVWIPVEVGVVVLALTCTLVASCTLRPSVIVVAVLVLAFRGIASIWTCS